MTPGPDACIFTPDLALLGEYGDHPNGLEALYAEVCELADELPEHAVFVEVGTREGGSALLWMHAIARSKHPQRWLWTVDPYGDKEYMGWTTLGYGEEKYRKAMDVLAREAKEHGVNWYHWRLRSDQFLAGWEVGILSWHYGGEELVAPEFGFVYLDGDHRPEVVLDEVKRFGAFLCEGTLVVVDDESFIPEGHPVRVAGEVRDDRIHLTCDQVLGVE